MGNITRAAEELNYTQSGVSHAIAALEKETGFPLFVRNSSGVVLTNPGKEILEPIQNLVNEKKKLEQSIFHINHVVAGTIRIGTFTSVSTKWLPDMILDFQKKYPKVTFEILDGDYDDICEWLNQGRIDCGFLTEHTAENYYFLPLKKDPMMVLLAKDHPLAKQKVLTLEQVLKEPFIMQKKGSDNDVRQILSNIKKAPKIRYVLNDDTSVMAMVERGFGIGILPELILQKFSFDLIKRPLDPPQYRTIGLAAFSKKQLSVVGRTFFEYLSKLDLAYLS